MKVLICDPLGLRPTLQVFYVDMEIGAKPRYYPGLNSLYTNKFGGQIVSLPEWGFFISRGEGGHRRRHPCPQMTCPFID